MKLILFTAKNCPKCPLVKKVVEEVATELGMEQGKDYQLLTIDEGDNLITALQYQIASTPSIVINGEAAFVGEVPKKEELIERLKKG
jgi:small redox-active disulfide protein 1